MARCNRYKNLFTVIAVARTTKTIGSVRLFLVRKIAPLISASGSAIERHLQWEITVLVICLARN